MKLTIEELLGLQGPVDITLWIRDGSAQVNVRETGSQGWACTTKPTAAEALREALEWSPSNTYRRPTHDDIDDLI